MRPPAEPILAPPSPATASDPAPPRAIRIVRNEALNDLKARVHEQLIHELDPEQLVGDLSFTSPARRAVEQAAEEAIGITDGTVGRQDRLRLASEIADEVLGYGPLEPLLRDPTITEVMVNSWDRVYFERNGIIHRSETTFRDDTHVLNIIDKILRPVSRRLDDSSPMVDARLPDGSRVNAVIPPLAVHGPSLTIRKFSRELLAADDLVRLGTLGRSMLDFLGACVRARANVLVSGGTGTGKTTLLNLLSSFIPSHERIVTIEDPAELQVKHEDWVSLETRPPNIENKGQIVQRDLVRNALRMRPDRIIVGECRGGEAFDMLQAMNTGHDGSLSTIHANSPRDALSRIENMVLMAVELPVSAIREQIASGINLLVHLSRLQDGTRRVTHVTEIVGMQAGVISMHDIFEFQGRGVDAHGQILGQLQATGLRPHFLDRLSQYGEHVPIEWFLPMVSPDGSRLA
ncbi:MAG: Flp pilus assembly complex ATPase component TadA [Chloroflexi bacterium]|nr:Flp pilus assembly complex ATPase component TadA [Chloroflexota bacterium]